MLCVFVSSWYEGISPPKATLEWTGIHFPCLRCRDHWKMVFPAGKWGSNAATVWCQGCRFMVSLLSPKDYLIHNKPSAIQMYKFTYSLLEPTFISFLQKKRFCFIENVIFLLLVQPQSSKTIFISFWMMIFI